MKRENLPFFLAVRELTAILVFNYRTVSSKILTTVIYLVCL